jgi:hypothetical protein
MRAISRSATTSVVVALLATVSCSTPKQSGAAGDTAQRDAASGAANDTISARARVAQLESDARALAKTSGCSSDSQCRTAPVGEKACGGPRTYIPDCSATTDSVALFKKLGELSVAEKAYNKSAGVMSTCEFRLPPAITVQGGVCRTNTPP